MWETCLAMRTKLSTSGRVMLPRQLLEQLGLQPGAVLDVKLEGGSNRADAEATAKGKNRRRSSHRPRGVERRTRRPHPHKQAGAENTVSLSVMVSFEVDSKPAPFENQNPKGAAPGIVLTPKQGRRRKATIIIDPISGFPALTFGSGAPTLTNKQVKKILSDFP
jgi:bifunctional DNA-binding transcriptional regulator/antitoxin component of YhaV-PrlF toxin-antitoxin module